MRFSKQEYRGELPFPPPGDLPDLEIKPVSLASPTLAGGFLATVKSPISVCWAVKTNATSNTDNSPKDKEHY